MDMKMVKWFFLGVLCFLWLNTPATASEPPRPVAVDQAVVTRLDAILERLTSIEQRLADVEADIFAIQELVVDDAGIVRLRSGRPVGFWGIDGPSPLPAF